MRTMGVGILFGNKILSTDIVMSNVGEKQLRATVWRGYLAQLDCALVELILLLKKIVESFAALAVLTDTKTNE